ncbi:hypothetical protein MRY82_07440 [bacterium]|nr:hypothetical protein [bacterium]
MMNKIFLSLVLSLMLGTTYAQHNISEEVNKLMSMCDQDLFSLAQIGIGHQYKEVHPTLGPSFHFSCYIQFIKSILGNHSYYQVSVRSEEPQKFYLSDYYENKTEIARIVSTPNTENLVLSDALDTLRHYINSGACYIQ